MLRKSLLIVIGAITCLISGLVFSAKNTNNKLSSDFSLMDFSTEKEIAKMMVLQFFFQM